MNKLNIKAIKAIKKYQATKNETIGSGRCKHFPSCSEYAIGCYSKFNFIKASLLSGWRIIRCNPFTHKIYDPVPLTKQEKKDLLIQEGKRNVIVLPILAFYQSNPAATTNDFILFIYQYTFKEPVHLDEEVILFNEYLYAFKQLVKKKKINLDYHQVYQEINVYLKDFIK